MRHHTTTHNHRLDGEPRVQITHAPLRSLQSHGLAGSNMRECPKVPRPQATGTATLVLTMQCVPSRRGAEDDNNLHTAMMPQALSEGKARASSTVPQHTLPSLPVNHPTTHPPITHPCTPPPLTHLPRLSKGREGSRHLLRSIVVTDDTSQLSTS